MTVRAGQLVSIAVQTATPKIRLGQVALISVQIESPPKIRFNQVAIITVVSGNINRTGMGPVIRLPCWQPCTAYGTRALIVDLSQIRKGI